MRGKKMDALLVKARVRHLIHLFYHADAELPPALGIMLLELVALCDTDVPVPVWRNIAATLQRIGEPDMLTLLRVFLDQADVLQRRHTGDSHTGVIARLTDTSASSSQSLSGMSPSSSLNDVFLSPTW